MSGPTQMADIAAQRAYVIAGYPDGGMLRLVRVEGRSAPNVVDLAAARARKQGADSSAS